MKKKQILIILLSTILLVNCTTTFNEVYKTTDYAYKYEAAKEYFAARKYNLCYQLLEDMVISLKGSDKAEESLYMLAMSYYHLHDYETAILYLDRYVKTYPKGTYTELCRYYSALSSFKESPDERLDQTPTYTAITKFQEYLELYPYSKRKLDVNNMIYELQDKLVKKEYLAAQLYYNLGSYSGNCVNGGSNFEACIITAQNAIKDYPYTNLREDLLIMILRARYNLASNSIEEKADARFRETVDEFYGFRNEFPQSKYMKEAEHIYNRASRKVKVGDKDEI